MIVSSEKNVEAMRNLLWRLQILLAVLRLERAPLDLLLDSDLEYSAELVVRYCESKKLGIILSSAI